MRRGERTRRVRGLGGEVVIERDDRGVPTVRAATEPDLYFGLGHAQATDRLWQMDVLRRRAHGRLSEVLGRATVAEDVRARRLALARVARASEELLSPACVANLRAFSAGVNAAVRRFALPPEFLLLRYRPEPWTPTDSVAIVKRLGFDLGLNLKYEVFRGRLAEEHPGHAAVLGVPRYPADGPVTVGDARRAAPAEHPPVTALPEGSREWLADLLDGERSVGSNAWVLAGSRTASGFPLLANDPHVLFTHPSLWYQLGLRLPGEAGYGVTVPGIPGLIAGANDDLAWGITNSTVDTQDLCGVDAAPTWREEGTVVVRGAGPVPVRAAGGDGYVEFGDDTALFWSGYTPSAEIEACQRMWRARSYVDFREVLRSFGVPVLNVLVAGRDGTIALKTAGRVPARVPGSGVAPGTFAEVSASWRRFVDFADLPEVVDPPSGYIVSANHKLVPGDELGQDWVAPYRASRIEELVLSTPRATAADCARWQLDDLNGRARHLLPALLAAVPADTPGREVLAAWDHRDDPDARAPLVFMRLLQLLGDEWFGTALGPDLAALVPDHTQQLDHLVLDEAARHAVGITEPLPAAVARALELAVAAGPERYGEVHRIVDPHPLGAGGALLKALFCRRPTPAGGSRHTVCLMAPNPAGEVIEGAPWRFVAHLTPDGTRLWDVLRHGSSGHPLSPHYDDQTRAHTRGDLHPNTLPTTGTRKLVLRPAGPVT